MYKKAALTVPTLCFLVGFLVTVLFLPSAGEIASDGGSYYADMHALSFFEIWINNTLMCLLFMLAGGIGSSLLLLAQGFTFGMQYVAWILMGNTGTDFWLLFLPHVLFECLAMALASYLGFMLLRFFLRKNGQRFKDLLHTHRFTLIATFATVAVAALIECFVTPTLYNLFQG